MSRSILLRLLGDPTNAQKAVRDLAADLRAFAREEASVQLRVEADKAKEQIKGVKRELKDLSAEGRIDIHVAAAEANITRIQERIKKLRGADFNVKVGAQLSGAVSQLEVAEKKLDGLKDKRIALQFEVLKGPLDLAVRELEHARELSKIKGKVDLDIDAALAKARIVKVEVDRATRGEGHKPFAALERDVADVVHGVEKLGTVVEGIGGVLAKIGTAALDAGKQAVTGLGQAATTAGDFASKLASAGPAGIALGAVLLAFLPVVGPFILGIVAAVASLVAVLGAAALGAAALGVAFLAVLGPIALVLFEVVNRIKDLVSASSKVNAAQQAVVVATNAQRNAQTRLQAAQEAQAAAAVAGENAKRDAILAVRDAYLAVEGAKLGVTDARLAVLDAKAALEAFSKQAGPTGASLSSLFAKFKNVDAGKLPGLLDAAVKSGKATQAQALQYLHLTENLAHANLQVQVAANQLTHATNSQSDAQKTANKFTTEGITAYAPYAAALDATAKAQQQVTDTTEKLAVAQDKLTRLGGATPIQKIEKGFQAAFHGIGNDVSQLFQPIVSKVLAGLTVLIGGLDKIAKNKEVQAGLKDIGGALGYVFKLLGTQLGTPEVTTAIAGLAKGAAAFIKAIGPALPDLLRLLLAIATEALPTLIDGAKRLASAFHVFVDGELKAGKLKKQIHFVLDALSKVWGLVKAAGRVLGDFFSSGIGPGKSLVEHATHLLDKLDKTLKTVQGKKDLKDFFGSAIGTVRDLWHALQDVLSVIKFIADAIKVGTDIFSFFGQITGVTPLTQFVAKTAGSIAGGGLDPGLVQGSYHAQQALNAARKRHGLPPLQFAEGGVATSPQLGIWAEAGPEAIIPLRDDVLAKIGRGIAQASTGLLRSHPLAPGGGGKVRDVHLNVAAPAGSWPEMSHALAVLEHRMNAIGA